MRHAAFSFAATGVCLLVASNPAWADETPYPYHMKWADGGFMGPFMMLFFLAVVIILFVLLVRRIWPGGTSGNSSPDVKNALVILEERYARGEIDKEEFDVKKQVIKS